MGIVVLKLGKPTPLLPDETVVLEQRRFRAVTTRTLPSYGIGFNLRPLWGISLLVTNRRCLVLTDLFHCMTQEIGIWYPGQNPRTTRRRSRRSVARTDSSADAWKPALTIPRGGSAGFGHQI